MSVTKLSHTQSLVFLCSWLNHDRYSGLKMGIYFVHMCQFQGEQLRWQKSSVHTDIQGLKFPSLFCAIISGHWHYPPVKAESPLLHSCQQRGPRGCRGSIANIEGLTLGVIPFLLTLCLESWVTWPCLNPKSLGNQLHGATMCPALKRKGNLVTSICPNIHPH